MKRITKLLLVHMLGAAMPFSRIFLLMRKLTLHRFKKTVDAKFPHELVDSAALPAGVYLGLKKTIGKRRAFEIMRIALLTGGTATQNL